MVTGAGPVGTTVALQLAEAGVVVEITRELLALLEYRTVEEFADLGEGAVEVALLQQFLPTTVDLLAQLVESAHVRCPATQQLSERPLRRRAGHDIVADRLQRLAQIDRRRERIGSAAVPLVARTVEALARHVFSLVSGLPEVRAELRAPAP